MKLNKIISPLALALSAALAATGCSHKYAGNVTNIPHRPGVTEGNNAGRPNPSPTLPVEPPPAPPFSLPNSVPTSTPNAVPNPPGTTPTSDINLENYTLDRVALAAYTVHFKFDSAVVQEAEQANLAAVAQALGDPNMKLLIEGHCDERGSDEYNRGLGERRANSIRDYMITAGIAAERIQTISFGEEKPAVPNAKTEEEFAQNRRGEFVVYITKK